MSSVNYKSVRIPQNKGKFHSVVNLSYNKKTTVSPNLLIPLVTEQIEPGDVWNLKITGFLRWLYLKVPSLDTLKLSLNVFVADHIDLCDDYQKVRKGSGNSEYDTRQYKLPVLSNFLAPVYKVYSLANTSIAPKYYLPKYTLAQLSVGASSSSLPTPDFDMSDPTSVMGMILKTPIMMQFNAAGVQRLVYFPFAPRTFDVIASSDIPSNSSYYDNNKIMFTPRPKIGGLYEYLYGVVGDAPKNVSALPAVMYYKIFDYYYRPQQHVTPFVAIDKDIDKTIDEKAYSLLTQANSAYSLDIEHNFMCIFSGSGNDKIQHLLDGCVCNTWDEMQYTLSRFICGGQKDNFWVSGITAGSIHSSNLYKLVTYLSGGLCPVFKTPDYFTMATKKPSLADNIDLPFPSALDADTSGLVSSLKVVSAENRIATGEITPSSPLSTMPRNALLFKTPSVSFDAYVGRSTYSLSSLSESVSALIQDNAAGYSSSLIYDSGLGIEGEDAPITFTPSGMPTVVDLRSRVLLQKFNEKIGANGFLFQDFMMAFFGVEVEDKQLRIPRYYGGTTASFDIIPVVQQSAKLSEDGSPLGSLAANAVCSFSTNFIRFTSQMGGLVMVMLSITGNNSYQEGYQRWLFEKLPMELYNPFFLGLGDQAIMNAELFNPAFLYTSNLSAIGVSGTTKVQLALKTASDFGILNGIENATGLGTDASFEDYVNSIIPGGNTKYHSEFFVDLSSDAFTRGLEQAREGFGFIPRAQDRRTAMNRIGGNFKSRSNMIATVNPSISTFMQYGGAAISQVTVQSGNSGDYVTNIPSLDLWTLAEDNDYEQVTISKDVLDGVFLSDTPRLNSLSLVSAKPWQRLVDYTDMPPIYCSVNVIAHVIRNITAQSVPGQGIHL